MSELVAVVLAGGPGTRLMPLTDERSKPAVPFGGRYRIADFVLSNLVNSGIQAIYVLVQYKSQSLIDHLTHGWINAHDIPSATISVVPPQMRDGDLWFQGTADAVRQNHALLERNAPDIVGIFGADHIYRMDVRQMIDFHRARKAGVTVAGLPVPLRDANRFGVMNCERDGRVVEFLEKPASPPAMSGHPEHAMASMGNYIFDAATLREALDAMAGREKPDFGHDVVPWLVSAGKAYAYDFRSNIVPGVGANEEPGYWRDVGTLESYFGAHMDVLGEQPRFDLFNPQWQIHTTAYNGPAARSFGATVENSILCSGTLVSGATVRNSIIGHEVRLERGAVVEDSIVMDYCVIGAGAHLKRAIVDRYNVVEAGSMLHAGSTLDPARYSVTKSGIVVAPKAQFDPTVPRYF